MSTEATSAPAAAPSAAAAAPANDAHKVFAGNLAFATTEADIKAIFAEAGNVEHVQIITRGTRSLGYCFITYSTESEAQKAVSTLNKKVVAGREINVEAAKPQEELEATREAKAAARKEKAAAKRARQQEAKAAAAGAEGTDGAAAGDAPAKKSKARKPRARKARTDEGEEPDNVDGAGDAAAVGEDGKKKSSQRTRKPKATKAAVANGEVDGADGEGAAKKASRQPRGPKGAPEGEASKTLLFVANLSFEVDDASLKSAFVDLASIEPKTTHVVRRRFGARRSKGFGFVDLASEDEQKKALETLQGKEWKGRPLSLKVAIQGAKEEAEAEAKAEQEKAEVVTSA